MARGASLSLTRRRGRDRAPGGHGSSRAHHSAGGVVVRDGSVLLICPRPGRWQLPKGHLEPGEDSATAATREVAEETGVEARIVTALGAIDFSYRAGRRLVVKRVDYFLMEYASGSVEACHCREVEMASWFAADEAVERLSFDNERDVVRRALSWLAGETWLAGERP